MATRPRTAHEKAYDAAYQNQPEQIKKREERNKARYQMEKAGKVHKGDGKDVDHKQMLMKGGSNDPSNWRVKSATENRSRNQWSAKKK
jgi:hypothetical protein